MNAQQPLTGAVLAVTAVALALGTFMQVLDSTIANVSLPTIAGNLGVSTDNGTWIVTSFAVANGVSLPLTGWLMGRFGVVKTFVWSVLLFTLASFLCGIAWNLESLIAFRILQGAVSGPMIPGSQALLLSIFPANKRTMALAVWSMTTLIAPIVGPILGGYISDNYHWSWIFLINLPVGLLCAAICWRVLASRETPTFKRPIDTIGVGMLVIWVGALQIMLDLGKNADWFQSSIIVVCTIIAVVGFLAWLIWELTDDHPAVDLRLLRDRNFALGTIAFCLGYAVFFANVLLLPLWLQTQMGYTATWAGFVAAPSGLVAVVLTPLVARIGERVDPRLIGSLAFGAFALSYFMRANFTNQVDFLSLTLPMLVNGVAMSGFFVTMVTIQLDRIPQHQVPSATGISNFARITCGSFAASIITTAWDRRTALHQSQLVETLPAGSAAYDTASTALGNLGLGDTQTAAVITHRIVQEATLLGADDLFWVSGWLSVAMIALVWLTRRPTGATAMVAAE
ncbi:MAG: DHA2 family efflux MFS transporter permease subunit [Parahaliea sp.]